MPDLATILTNAPCIVENPWGAQWDGPCSGGHMEGGGIHIPCAIAALEGQMKENDFLESEIRRLIGILEQHGIDPQGCDECFHQYVTHEGDRWKKAAEELAEELERVLPIVEAHVAVDPAITTRVFLDVARTRISQFREMQP